MALMEVAVEPSEERTATVVPQVGGTMVDAHGISSFPPPEEEEREDHLREKDMECKVLRLNLAKEKDVRAVKGSYAAVGGDAGESKKGRGGVSLADIYVCV
ncbi:hypothetical protein AXG93_3954s1100 [Marchantia polymorpha subsp. ruderalis]|uniref:Uncharacterized protein n=1 Tax=Marchantia polymorpha subsp. ruderalis TaxID=1480154 RepID=A0A176VKJ9_MARPO|nr:hypothetical protein AXG93_3954s1100 [Marchantia polymorpha subsp. ruderalis]